MKKSNALFIVLTAASVVLIGAIMTDNVLSTCEQTQGPAAIETAANQNDARATEVIRQKFIKMGLPLHEGNYWKKAHE